MIFSFAFFGFLSMSFLEIQLFWKFKSKCNDLWSILCREKLEFSLVYLPRFLPNVLTLNEYSLLQSLSNQNILLKKIQETKTGRFTVNKIWRYFQRKDLHILFRQLTQISSKKYRQLVLIKNMYSIVICNIFLKVFVNLK